MCAFVPDMDGALAGLWLWCRHLHLHMPTAGLSRGPPAAGLSINDPTPISSFVLQSLACLGVIRIIYVESVLDYTGAYLSSEVD